MDGVGAIPRRLAAQGRAGREGRRPARPRRAARAAGPVAGARSPRTCGRPRSTRSSTPGSRTAARTWRRPGRRGTPGPSRRTRWPTPASSSAPASVRSSATSGSTAPSTERLEELFADMAAQGYATSTIDRNWNYLNQALQHAVRHRTIKTNPAADVLLPERRPSKERKSFTIDQAQRLLVEAIPADSPARDVAHGPDVRPAAGRAGRSSLAASSTSTPSRPASTCSSGPSRSTTAMSARWRRRRLAASAGIGLHPLLVAALTAPPRRDAAARASTTTRASCSAPATARR